LTAAAGPRHIHEMVAPLEDRQRIDRLTPLDDVLAHIARLVAPVRPYEVRTAAAWGATLAEDIVAGQRPATALAMIDGFAVRADATIDASAYAPAVLADARPVDAGEPMPAGSDAVAPVEAVAFTNSVVEIMAPVAPGDGVLHPGTDAGPREVVQRAGARLRASDVAAIQALGIGSVMVRRPRLLFRCARAHCDPIADAVMAWLGRAVATDGGEPMSIGAGAPMQALLSENDADGFVIVGGTGSGRDDHAVKALSRIGSVEVHGIALSPGETTAFGIANGRPVLLLPGRLDAALAAWLTVGRGLLARLRGGGRDEEPGSPATLALKVASTVGLTELVLVRLTAEGAMPLAAKYLPLTAFAHADGWILVPAASEGYPAGATVMVRALP
jgi:molybdopterin molybdotransferase